MKREFIGTKVTSKFLDRIDEFCCVKGWSKSYLIRRAIVKFIKDEESERGQTG